MSDFWATVLAGLLIPLILSPVYVATKFPDKFNVLERWLNRALLIMLVPFLFFALGYLVGAESQRAGEAWSIADIKGVSWILAFISFLALIYLGILKRTVVAWTLERKDQTKDK